FNIFFCRTSNLTEYLTCNRCNIIKVLTVDGSYIFSSDIVIVLFLVIYNCTFSIWIGIFHFYSSSFLLCNRFQIWFTLIIPIVHVFFKHLNYKKTCLYIFLYLRKYIDKSFYITLILLFKPR